MAASWTCPHCGMTSYNLNDVEHRYCGNCHHYCDQVPNPRWQVKVSGQAHGKGILLSDDLEEVREFVMAHLTGGVEAIQVYRWPAPGWVPP